MQKEAHNFSVKSTSVGNAKDKVGQQWAHKAQFFGFKGSKLQVEPKYCKFQTPISV